jgi:hypothetical protein
MFGFYFHIYLQYMVCLGTPCSSYLRLRMEVVDNLMNITWVLFIVKQ